MIPKGAKNIEVAKDFQKYLIQPEVNSEFLKGGLGRFLPTMPEMVKNDPWWTDPKRDPHVPPYVQQGLVSPTKPDYFAYNPAWAQVRAEHPFNVAFHDIVADGKPVKEAVDEGAEAGRGDLREVPDRGVSRLGRSPARSEPPSPAMRARGRLLTSAGGAWRSYSCG